MSDWVSDVFFFDLHAAIAHEVVILPPGDASKSFAQIEALLDDLLGRGIERGTTLVALGGGVIGDITGFAAAITLRGLDFVQIPTTLLAQVDSSRSEEHTSELQSLMRISYAVFCLKKKKHINEQNNSNSHDVIQQIQE